MIWNFVINMLISFIDVCIRIFSQRNLSDIFVEFMLFRITVPVSLVCPDGFLVPFAGKHALSADFFKSLSDPTNTGKKINKTEFIIWMVGWWFWKHFLLKHFYFTFTQCPWCTLSIQPFIQRFTGPVILTYSTKYFSNSFLVIGLQYLINQRLVFCNFLVFLD